MTPLPVFCRRAFLAGTAAFLSSAVCSPTAAAGASTFFVATAGDDNADGLSPATAWATLQKAAAAAVDGSTVLFRRGDAFYGEFTLPQGCSIGAYGNGADPMLSMFKVLNRAPGWQQHAPGIWKIQLGTPDSHDGYNLCPDANLGYLVVDGMVRSSKMMSLNDLVNPWDFWSDVSTSTLYVASPDIPTSVAADIKAAPRGVNGAVLTCNIGSNSIQNLHISGSGGHGIVGSGTDVQIRDCLIDYIGGSFLPDSSNRVVRYGNAIENWVGAKRWVIERNEISETYDVAYTCQGTAYSDGDSWEDIKVLDNHIHDCTQSFEFWSKGTGADTGFKNIQIKRNICERGGGSAFSATRPNQAVRVHLLTYDWELPADILIENNTFSDAVSAYCYFSSKPDGLISRNNTISLEAGTKIQFQRSETIEQFAAWQSATGEESGSVFQTLH